ncbi:MAG: hypothetical protein GX748_19585 [Lentisphaerae bacterium]|nr:hypothetical protein [Lentisphaerota bacterium]
MTTHAIYIDARRPEAQFSLRIMGYSASSVEISVLNGAALADLTGQGIALWYGPVPDTGQPQLGHTVTGTVTASGCAVVDLALADTGYEGRLVAQVVSIVDGVSSVLGSGEIWMLANPARDTLPMTFDAPPWATADDVDAAISARVADVEDLPASPTYDQVIALLRAVLSALKGAATIALAMLALGAGAQTSRLGSLRAGDVVVTVESDPVALPVAEAAYHAATNITAASIGALPQVNPLALGKIRLEGPSPVITVVDSNSPTSQAMELQMGRFFWGPSASYNATFPNASGVFALEGYADSAASSAVAGHDSSGGAHAALFAVCAKSNWVESTRGVHADIASNVVWHVVVSNGHWLIREGN